MSKRHAAAAARDGKGIRVDGQCRTKVRGPDVLTATGSPIRTKLFLVRTRPRLRPAHFPTRPCRADLQTRTKPMRDLNWDLLQLQRRTAAGSHATRRDRAYAGADGEHSPRAGLPGSAGERAGGEAHRGAGARLVQPGTVRRHHDEPHGARPLVGGPGRQGQPGRAERRLRHRAAQPRRRRHEAARPRRREARAGEGRARADGAAVAGGLRAAPRGGDQVHAVA